MQTKSEKVINTQITHMFFVWLLYMHNCSQFVLFIIFKTYRHTNIVVCVNLVKVDQAIWIHYMWLDEFEFFLKKLKSSENCFLVIWRNVFKSFEKIEKMKKIIWKKLKKKNRSLFSVFLLFFFSVPLGSSPPG